MRTWAIPTVAALAFGCSSSSTSGPPAGSSEQGAFPRYSDSAALRSRMEQVRDGYVAEMRRLNLAVPFVPAVDVRTEPNIVFFSKGTVVAPLYGEAPAPFRSLLAEWGGGEAEGEELFFGLFNWFFLAHELSHYLQQVRGVVWDGYQNEQHANDAAVAYWMTTPDGPAKLERLDALLEKVIGRVKTEMFKNGFDRVLFDLNKGDIDTNPVEYGFAQFTMVRSSIARRAELSLGKVLDEATTGGIDCAAVAPRIAAGCPSAPDAIDACSATLNYLSGTHLPACDSTLAPLLACYRGATEFACLQANVPPTPPACQELVDAQLGCVQSNGMKL